MVKFNISKPTFFGLLIYLLVTVVYFTIFFIAIQPVIKEVLLVTPASNLKNALSATASSRTGTAITDQQVVQVYTTMVDQVIRGKVIPGNFNASDLQTLMGVIGVLPANLLTDDGVVINPTSLIPKLVSSVVMPMAKAPDLTFKEIFMGKLKVSTEADFLTSVYTHNFYVSTYKFFHTKSIGEFFALFSNPKTQQEILAAEPQTQATFGFGLLAGYGNSLKGFEVLSSPASKFISQTINDMVDDGIAKMYYMFGFSWAIWLFAVVITVIFRHRLEIRSKHYFFSIHLLFAVFLLNLFGILHCNTATASWGNDITRSLLGSLPTAMFWIFLSAINCRHYMVHKIFTKSGDKIRKMKIHQFYFFPLIWHMPLIIAGQTILFFVFKKNIFDGKFDDFIISASVTMAITFLFLAETFYLLFKTRKFDEFFSDFKFNLRVTPYIAVITLSLQIYGMTFWAYQAPLLTIVAYTMVMIPTSAYLLDAYFLLFVKLVVLDNIDQAHPLVLWFQSVDFIAEKPSLTHMENALRDLEFRQLIIDYSAQNHCEENVQFLISLIELEKIPEPHRINAFHDLNERFFKEGAIYELNLTYKGKKPIIELYANDDEMSKRAMTEDPNTVFSVPKQEIQRLFQLNTFNQFIAQPHIQKQIQERNILDNRLVSAGLIPKSTVNKNSDIGGGSSISIVNLDDDDLESQKEE